MADYHLLHGSHDGNSYTVVHHLPVPDVNNRVGVNVRTALVNSGLGGKTLLTEGTGAGQITTAEKAQVTAGAVYEFVEVFATNPGETALAIRDRLDARHTELVALLQTRLQNQLSYFGFTRIVP